MTSENMPDEIWINKEARYFKKPEDYRFDKDDFLMYVRGNIHAAVVAERDSAYRVNKTIVDGALKIKDERDQWKDMAERFADLLENRSNTDDEIKALYKHETLKQSTDKVE